MNSNTIMKKINSIWAILLFAIVPMLFTSCEQQQDASNAILGTWKLEKMSYRRYYDGVLEDEDAYYVDDLETFEFFSDGQMTVTYEYYSEYEGYMTETEDYQYQIDGNRLYTNYFGGEIQYFRIKRLTSHEMILLVEHTESNLDGEFKSQNLFTFTK